MRITGEVGIDLFGADVPLARPLVTSRGTVDRRRLLLVRIRTAEGAGWGEAAPLAGFSGIGIDTARHHLLNWMESSRATRTIALLAEGPAPVKAAIESALVDLAAGRAGVPASSWLAAGPGPQEPARSAPESVAVNGVVSGVDPDAIALSAATLARAGFGVLKLKVGGEDPSVDVERVRAAWLGSGGLPLRLDANRGWNPSTALRVLRRLGGIDIEYVEEPTADPATSARVCADTGFGLALDETWRNPQEGLAVTRAGDLHTAVLKPSALGGPLTTLRLARTLARLGVRTVVSSLVDGPAGLAAAVHLAVVVGPGPHGLATAEMFEPRFDPWLYPTAGHLRVPDQPGLGSGLTPMSFPVTPLGSVSGPMTVDLPSPPPPQLDQRGGRAAATPSSRSSPPPPLP